MIQRIQSIFLLLAGALGIAALFLPVSHFYNGFKLPVDINSIVENYPYWLTGGLIKVAALISLGSIFLYKNRKRQINVTRVSQLFLLAVLIFGVYMFYPFDGLKDTAKILPNAQKYITKHWAIFMPFAMLVFNALAIYFIKKDHKIVRSSERLR